MSLHFTKKSAEKRAQERRAELISDQRSHVGGFKGIGAAQREVYVRESKNWLRRWEVVGDSEK
jgi:hypothetical protein